MRRINQINAITAPPIIDINAELAEGVLTNSPKTNGQRLAEAITAQEKAVKTKIIDGGFIVTKSDRIPIV
ncbi:MAG: hypothetical protein ABIK19_00780, partial [candidate division WOR-3 bacterium]